MLTVLDFPFDVYFPVGGRSVYLEQSRLAFFACRSSCHVSFRSPLADKADD